MHHIYIKNWSKLVVLTIFLVVLIPIYAKVFTELVVNYDNLLLGLLSGLMIN